jgi:hypothetical protein
MITVAGMICPFFALTQERPGFPGHLHSSPTNFEPIDEVG